MDKTLQELKNLIRELILEMGQLKERVAYLEKAFGETPVNSNPPQEALEAQEIELALESYENLGRVYNKGFHVCPAAFAQKRTGECLFCLAFMGKE